MLTLFTPLHVKFKTIYNHHTNSISLLGKGLKLVTFAGVCHQSSTSTCKYFWLRLPLFWRIIIHSPSFSYSCNNAHNYQGISIQSVFKLPCHNKIELTSSTYFTAMYCLFVHTLKETPPMSEHTSYCRYALNIFIVCIHKNYF